MPERATTERGAVDAHAAVVHQCRYSVRVHDRGRRDVQGDLAVTVAHGRVERVPPLPLDQIAHVEANEFVDRFHVHDEVDRLGCREPELQVFDTDLDRDVIGVLELGGRHRRRVNALELEPDPTGQRSPVRPLVALRRRLLPTREQMQASVDASAVAAVLDHYPARAQDNLKLRHVPVLELVVLAHAHHVLEFAKDLQATLTRSPLPHGLRGRPRA